MRKNNGGTPTAEPAPTASIGLTEQKRNLSFISFLKEHKQECRYIYDNSNNVEDIKIWLKKFISFF